MNLRLKIKVADSVVEDVVSHEKLRPQGRSILPEEGMGGVCQEHHKLEISHGLAVKRQPVRPLAE